jgi:hypothetical protein
VFARRQSTLAPRPRGDPNKLLKRAIEGRLGFIADFSRRPRDAEARLFEQPTRELKAPSFQIVQRGDADVVGKTLGEDRAREAGFPREPVQGPRLGGARMNEPQHLADMRIAQSGQPSTRLSREGFEVAAITSTNISSLSFARTVSPPARLLRPS